jgi:dTDP-4-dehydrorhamnose 3,5-epimerase
MDTIAIEGVILTPLKQMFHPQGDVFHAMKASDDGFVGFAEAYFSTIHCGEIKIWKKHLLMTLNFIVPVGSIRIVIFDDRNNSSTRGEFLDITLGRENYQRITIPPGMWVAFLGIDSGLNLLLNIANMEHDPNEIKRKDKLEEIKYIW